MVIPSTNIRLLKGVPLDNTYTNTLWFDTSQEQIDYFNSFVGTNRFNLTEQTYQRVNSNRARVSINAGKLYGVNYMMFQNEAYSNKWFYAFVLEVEYVNDNCCEITYELDVFQTWQFDFQLGGCYIEREHVIDDTIGKNTVDEQLPIGEYIVEKQQEFITSSGVMGSFLINTEEGVSELEGKLVNGVYTSLLNIGVPSNAIGMFNNTMRAFEETPENVAMVVMVADKMVEKGEPKEFEDTFAVTSDKVFAYKDERYTPKNNKVYCYPYRLFTVDNYNGNSEDFKWEDFENNFISEFTWKGAPVPKPIMWCYPRHYKNLVQARQYAITYDNFPLCPYTNDTFKAWSSQTIPKTLANTGASVVNSFLSASASALVAGMSKKPEVQLAGSLLAKSTVAQQLVSTANNIINLGVDTEYNKLHSTSLGGTIEAGGMNYSEGQIGFRSTCFQIKPEFARIIDEYFTRYGYKVNRVDVPVLHSRKSFNYIKTNSCSILGIMPTKDREKLIEIFNAGVTLWHDTDNVGDYSLDNDIII